MKRKAIDRPIIEKAAKRLPRLLDGLKPAERDLLAAAITEAYQYPMNKRRLAKVLEDEFGWDVDLLDLHGLSKMDDLVREEHRKACKVQGGSDAGEPKLTIGTRVICISANLQGKVKDVPVEEAPGCYLLSLNPKDGGSEKELITPFEDVLPQ